MRSKAVNIIFLIAGITVAMLVLYGLRGRKKFDEKVSLRKKDNIPYGTAVAYRTLPDLFPGASISSSRSMPGSWDSLSLEESNQAYICITGQFDPDEYELNKIIELVQAGNDVFISATELSYNAESKLLQSQEATTVNYKMSNRGGDTLALTLLSPVRKTWQYPGKNYGYVFNKLDTSRALILGEEEGVPDFIQLNSGKGRLFLHRSPLAFSNYFLLHKNNFEYFEKAMSYLSPGVKRVVWDEYFLTQRHKKERKESWFSVLMRYPGLSTAVIMGLIMLLIYAFAEMRRKQRIIPPYSRPANDSMDFVKTIGRLYFEKGDHRNLAKKMSAYFLEHVRSRYKISTGILDDKFVKALQFKTGVDSELIQAIVTDINELENQYSLSAQQLNRFYNKLENFYRTA